MAIPGWARARSGCPADCSSWTNHRARTQKHAPSSKVFLGQIRGRNRPPTGRIDPIAVPVRSADLLGRWKRRRRIKSLTSAAILVSYGVEMEDILSTPHWLETRFFQKVSRSRPGGRDDAHACDDHPAVVWIICHAEIKQAVRAGFSQNTPWFKFKLCASSMYLMTSPTLQFSACSSGTSIEFLLQGHHQLDSVESTRSSINLLTESLVPV